MLLLLALLHLIRLYLRIQLERCSSVTHVRIMTLSHATTANADPDFIRHHAFLQIAGGRSTLPIKTHINVIDSVAVRGRLVRVTAPAPNSI